MFHKRKSGLILFLYFIFFFFSQNLSANSSDFKKFNFSAYTGMQNGCFKEFYICEFWNGNKETVSLLDWYFYTPSISMKLDYNSNMNFYFSLHGNVSLPSSAGYMEDFDWMNIYTTGEKGLTHYSWNTNKTVYFFDGDFSLGYRWKLGNWFSLVNFGGLNFRDFKFSAVDGFKQYGKKDAEGIYEPWSPDIEKKMLSGEMVTLSGVTANIGAGFKLDFTAKNGFGFSFAEGFYYAFFSELIDSHPRKSEPIALGYQSKGVFTSKSEFDFFYKINENFTLEFYSAFDFSPEKLRNVYQKSLTGEYDWGKIRNSYGNYFGDFRQMAYTISVGFSRRF